MNRFQDHIALMRWDKPIGIFLLLWPSWWALWVSTHGAPPLGLTLIFTLGTFLMRSAGCIINDAVDQPLDRFVERTQGRPLARGALSRIEAMWPLAICLGIALILLFMLKIQTWAWALLGLVLTLVYPWVKRFSHLPQLVLALAFGMPIPMIFSETTGTVLNLDCLTLFMANALWVLAYDTIYARVDREDDLKCGIKSTAILMGDLDTTFIALFDILMLVFLVMMGVRHHYGLSYYAVLAICLPFFALQFFLMHSKRQDDALAAFLHNNAIGALVFLAFFVS